MTTFFVVVAMLLALALGFVLGRVWEIRERLRDKQRLPQDDLTRQRRTEDDLIRQEGVYGSSLARRWWPKSVGL